MYADTTYEVKNIVNNICFVGDCPPLKESPGRVPAAGEFFFNYSSKLIISQGNYHWFGNLPM